MEIGKIEIEEKLKSKQKNLTTTIVVSRELRNWLGEQGNKEETFDDIIMRLCNMKGEKPAKSQKGGSSSKRDKQGNDNNNKKEVGK